MANKACLASFFPFPIPSLIFPLLISKIPIIKHQKVPIKRNLTISMELCTCEKIGETNRMLDAAFKGDLNLFKRLAHELDEENDLAGKIASCKDDGGRNALYVAALGGRTHILKYLFSELKLDVNVKDGQGYTPLHYAIQRKHFPTAVYLIDNGANLNSMNDEGLTALHCAAMEGPKKLLQLLISKGAKVDANSDTGTPLQRAAAEGKKDYVKVLLANNANPNICSYHTDCALVLAIIRGSMECVKLLLKAGADPNITSGVHKPLYVAVLKGDTEIVKSLLNAGADPNVQNDLGLTPIEVAALAKNHDVVMTLYPITSTISDYPDWSVDGIMVYIHSDEMWEKREHKIQWDFMDSRLKGAEAVKRMDNHDAIKWYTKAINCDGMDATSHSNRSLCCACLKNRNNALIDAKMCLQLNPFWPKAYYRLGVTWMLLKEFEKAADAFYDGLKLDPENIVLDHAFREAVVAQLMHG